jgi:thiamine biosynthesis lipoprotein
MYTLSRSQPLLGTFVEVDISSNSAKDDLASLSTVAFGEISRIQSLMSFHDENSELSNINKNAAQSPMQISSAMATVLAFALELSELTNGAYDISVASKLMANGGLPKIYDDGSLPGSWRDIKLNGNSVYFERDLKIDLGGIAKGFAVDSAFNSIMQHAPNLAQFSINAGGDLRMHRWENKTIRLRAPDPRKRKKDLIAEMQNTALATSAPGYTNCNSLIVDRQSGQKVKGADSVSVFAPTCMAADALTKVAFLSDDSAPILRRFGATCIKHPQSGHQVDDAA